MLCTFNGERFLQAQINSLLQQTYPNFEIIVSDDHSTDGTKAILDTYKNDTRFHIFFQPMNVGAISNFELATRKTSGEFVTFCDQDDIWLPEKIEKLFHAIGDKWLVYSDSILVDEKGQSLQKNLSQLRKMYSGADTRGFVFSNVVWGHTMMVSRQMLPYLLPIPKGVPHDIWFALKATIFTGIIYLDEPLTLYRQHSKTITTSIPQKASKRPLEKRYEDFEEKLNWICVIKESEHSNRKLFYEKLYELYSYKLKGKFLWPLFFFLLKYRKVVFLFSQKSMPSQFIEIWKLSRGEHR